MVRESGAVIDDLVLEVIRGEDLTAEQQEEIIDLCSRAYQEDYEELFRSFPETTHILARLQGASARRPGPLVSHALWVTRWLQAGELPPLRTAYIETVATEEAFRGRGYASSVMNLAARQIQAFDLGGLSPAETTLYARLGWAYWRGPLSIRTPQGLLPTPGERVMILRLPNTPPGLHLDMPLSAEWREGELW
jgi:GNAT superfamily N-acetyltransferase